MHHMSISRGIKKLEPNLITHYPHLLKQDFENLSTTIRLFFKNPVPPAYLFAIHGFNLYKQIHLIGCLWFIFYCDRITIATNVCIEICKRILTVIPLMTVLFVPRVQHSPAFFTVQSNSFMSPTLTPARPAVSPPPCDLPSSLPGKVDFWPKRDYSPTAQESLPG